MYVRASSPEIKNQNYCFSYFLKPKFTQTPTTHQNQFQKFKIAPSSLFLEFHKLASIEDGIFDLTVMSSLVLVHFSLLRSLPRLVDHQNKSQVFAEAESRHKYGLFFFGQVSLSLWIVSLLSSSSLSLLETTTATTTDNDVKDNDDSYDKTMPPTTTRKRKNGDDDRDLYLYIYMYLIYFFIHTFTYLSVCLFIRTFTASYYLPACQKKPAT